MNIVIPDDVKDKRSYCRIQMTIYALTLFNDNRKKAHQFLGISIRTLRNWIKDYPELHKYKKERPGGGNAKWKHYEDGPIWKTKSPSQIKKMK